MREQHIRTWLASLEKSFGKPYPLVDVNTLHRCFSEKRYTDFIVGIRDQLKLSDVGFRIQYIKSGGNPNRVAGVSIPTNMPTYGSSAFKTLKLDMFVRKEFLELGDFAVALMIISHEMSHVVLDSLHHELQFTEPAVDLTAMYLGFRQAFITKNTFENTLTMANEHERSQAERLESLLGKKGVEKMLEIFPVKQLVYLTFKERVFAAKLMGTDVPLMV